MSMCGNSLKQASNHGLKKSKSHFLSKSFLKFLKLKIIAQMLKLNLSSLEHGEVRNFKN
jgi:hypothetical protein